MTIAATPAKLHWNYFLALERDLEVVSRYVEFDERNLSVFSIELAHLLFAAASEVDVVAKLLCDCVAPGSAPNNINEYRAVLVGGIADLSDMQVCVPRYGLSFKPWVNWAGTDNPDWWGSYNKVKHARNGHFHEATLKNALNAMGALLILTYHLYARTLRPGAVLAAKQVMSELEPKSILIRLDGDYYYHNLVI